MPEKHNPFSFRSNVSVAGGLSIAQMRDAAMADPKAFYARLLDPTIDPQTGKARGLIPRGDISWENVGDLRGLFSAFADVQVPVQVGFAGTTRAVTASAFPLIAGGLTQTMLEKRYAEVPTIGQDLVTDMRDNKRVTTLAGITSMDKNTDRVDENDSFPEISAGEEKYEIRSKRNGRKLSITAETIEENDVADIVQRINALSEIASEWVEEQTLDRVTDRYGSAASAAEPYVLHMNGAAASLYTTTANNPGARAPSGTRVQNNPLVDNDSLEAVRTVLAAMKNDRGRRINIPVSSCVLLVPDALVPTADAILDSVMVPGVENEQNSWGPRGRYRPRLVSSTKLDDISTTAWYLGDFKRQFKRKWKLNFEYVTLSGDTQAFLDKRVAFQARVAWDVEVGATDYVYVIQSLSGTSAP